MTVRGWIFDAYPLAGRMVFWIRQENGRTVRLEDGWTHSIYAAASDESDYSTILKNEDIMSLVRENAMVMRYERITDGAMSRVLKLTLKDSTHGPKLAKKIESLCRSFQSIRLYNVDLPPAQSYFYEHDLFALAFCEVTSCQSDAAAGSLKWSISDDIDSSTYKVPAFTKVRLDARIKKSARIPAFGDPLTSIVLESEGGRYEIEGDSEFDTLRSLEEEIEKLDPDFVLTSGGDSFLFPYLVQRAQNAGCPLSLGREKNMPLGRPAKQGVSYFSYGRIYYKPTATNLYGRVHIDTDNSFLIDAASMHGLCEVARLCRMPLHIASRASIGKCLSSLQFYRAVKRDILIPWKPSLPEHFKTFGELLVADRGGFIFEPRTGVYEGVAEFDFVSLYPSIIRQKNISAETVRCSCCPDSRERVPELGYNICEKKRGIVPEAIEVVIKKRAGYKKLQETTGDEKARAVYDARREALKWISVATFGYLGFNNAKFGRIDAHIAVCAFDRKILLQATRIAEEQGFRVLHGIVDSLWVVRKGGAADEEDYIRLKERIEKETKFAISFEGVYKWIAFLQSKTDSQLPVANRYFGAFRNGKLKIRGIEARRHDTPPLFRRFQKEILSVMAAGNTIEEVRRLMPAVRGVLDKYVELLGSGKVDVRDLLFTRRLSLDYGRYKDRNVAELHSLNQLAAEGRELRAGEAMRYLITNYSGRHSRTVPEELLDGSTKYDAVRYIELLRQTCKSVTGPFEAG